VSDIIQGVIGAINHTLTGSKFEIFNLGNSHPVSLKELVDSIQETTEKNNLGLTNHSSRRRCK